MTDAIKQQAPSPDNAVAEKPKKKTVKIGHYVVTGKIGQGGIAEIYRARQESLGRDVAIKILSKKLTDDPDIVRRFDRESMVIAKLNHPNIVHIIDKGKTAGRYFFVMEYVNGTSLREVIESDKIPMNTKLDMLVQVCKALDYAHKNGVIHRDIKPTNILIDRQGNALVADFGIAQIVGTPDGEMTASDVVMGTLSYMSPEQKLSSTNVDKTTDIYALGVVLYEMLVGKKPLGHFKPPSEIDPQINIKFDEIVLRCLAQDPQDRYQSAVELKNAILEVIGTQRNRSATDELDMESADSFMGKCRYLDTIKETDFGSTILVENRVSKRLYVIKKHRKGEAGRKEATVLGSLKHENIIKIHGAGGDKRNTVIIVDYAQGGSLADRMVRKWEWRKAFQVIRQVASGLDFAHKNNVIHGNLRPSNVLLDDNEIVKLTDFGLPTHYDAPKKKNWYSPPERKQSKQGDVYAMGVILHQMMLGRNPAYDSGSNLMLDEIRGEVPNDIVRMLSKMLSIRVANRYKTVEEFLLDYEDFENRRREAQRRRSKPKPAVAEAKKTTPAWMWAVLAAAIVTGVLVGLYVAGFFSG